MGVCLSFMAATFIYLIFLQLALSPFVSHLIVLPEMLADSADIIAPNKDMKNSNFKMDFPTAECYEHSTVSSHSLRKAVDIMYTLLELSHSCEHQQQMDIILTLLCDLSGGILKVE